MNESLYKKYADAVYPQRTKEELNEFYNQQYNHVRYFMYNGLAGFDLCNNLLNDIAKAINLNDNN